MAGRHGRVVTFNIEHDLMMDMLSHTETLSQVVTSTSLSTALCLQQIYKNYTGTLSSLDISYEFDFLHILSRDELESWDEI